jgi:hypothetical protein
MKFFSRYQTSPSISFHTEDDLVSSIEKIPFPTKNSGTGPLPSQFHRPESSVTAYLVRRLNFNKG